MFSPNSLRNELNTPFLHYFDTHDLTCKNFHFVHMTYLHTYGLSLVVLSAAVAANNCCSYIHTLELPYININTIATARDLRAL